MIARRTVLAAAAALPFSESARAQSAGVALVVGNSRYQWEAPLPNVRRDAPDVAKRLQALGLKTELLQDASRDAMRRAIDNFSAAARGARLAALYFAGHGAAWGKDTYLVPVDADLSVAGAVDSLVPVPSTHAAVASAHHRLLVFDNCRNNPADGWRQREAVEAAVIRPEELEPQAPETLVLYSTAPGRTALDGPAGDNSPFAAAFLRQLHSQSIDLQSLAPKLRRDLLIATEGRQVVWDRNTLQQPFQLHGSGAAAPVLRSAWASDPSKIIDIRNAYTYAQQNGLPLPAGLIAHRPAANSRDGQKVGAFSYTSVGNHPGLIVVMSVEEQTTAELIAVTRNPRGFVFWRFVRGALSGDTLEYQPRDGMPRLAFRWRDANSGSVSMLLPDSQRGGGGPAAFNSRFNRLDG